MKTRTLRSTLWVGMALLLVAIAVPATAQSWSLFSPATFTGVFVTPSLASGTTTYQLCLANGATVNGQPICWIQEFYAVGGTSATTFTATDFSNTLGWTFNSSVATGQIAGWNGTTANRLNTPTTPNTKNCGTFQFGTFTVPTGSSVVPGFQIGFGCNGESGFFKGQVSPVPELPSVLPAISVLLTAGAALLRPRRRDS